MPFHRANRFMVGVVIVGGLLAACGGGAKDVAAKSTSTTTSTTVPQSTTSATTSTTKPGAATDTTWESDAQQYRGRNGEKFTISCPPEGSESRIWGAGVYTDDSSICTAAVQVGLIEYATGGDVEIEIAPGEPEYAGGTANGVTSALYGSWNGSFTFPKAPPGSVQFTVGPESWERKATSYRGANGKRVTVECSPSGTPGSVWGTGTYTDDSSICTAAGHKGLITVATGGRVVIEIAPGAASYKGTTANGITSQDYPAFTGSFTFPNDQTTG